MYLHIPFRSQFGPGKNSAVDLESAILRGFFSRVLMATPAIAARRLQARSDSGLRHAWDRLEVRVQERLTAGGLGTPLSWAYAFVDEPADDLEQAMIDYAEGLCGPLPDGGWYDLSVKRVALGPPRKRLSRTASVLAPSPTCSSRSMRLILCGKGP